MIRPAVMPPAAAPRNLLTPRETADKLGVSTRTVWRLRDRGDLPTPVKLGACSRWDAAVLDQWIAAGCKAPARSSR